MANAELSPGALLKPARGSRKRLKARRRRREGVVVKTVREFCVERDGRCVIATRGDWAAVGINCEGESQWAHIGKHRRCHTRGMAPDLRHTSKGSAMLCEAHHKAYDAHVYDIYPFTALGMNGDFVVSK